MQIKEINVSRSVCFNIGQQYSNDVLVIHFKGLPDLPNKYIYVKKDNYEKEVPLVGDLYVVSRPLTTYNGEVNAQIIARDPGSTPIALTPNFKMIIAPSNYSGIGEDENYPDDPNIKNYFVKIDEKVNSFEELANLVQSKLDNGEFIGAQGPKGDPGEKGDPGDVTEEYRNLANQVAQNASDAQTSASNAQTSASNAQKILDDTKTFANQTKTELNQIKTDTSALKDEANASAVNAKASETKAEEYANNLQNSTETISQLKEDLDDLYGALTPFYTSVDLGSAIAGAVSKSDGSIIETGDVYHYRIPVTEGQKFVLTAWNAYSAYKAWLWLRKDGTVHSFYRNDSTYKQYTESVMAPCDGTLIIQQPYGHIPTAYILDGYRYSNLYQKKIYANGDSIMAGVGGVSFIAQIASKHNMALDNVAVGGTTFVTSNSNSITSRVLSMSGEFDYIIIEGGYNDVFGNSPIGTLTKNYSDSFDSATVLGAVETICKHLRVNYSASKTLFVLGHRQSGIGLSNTRLDTMWDAIITALNKWSMPYVDIRKEGTLMAYNSEWLSSYFGVDEAEGTHPNTLGYKLFYVPLVEAKLETL